MKKIDLLAIWQAERALGNGLFEMLNGLYAPADIKPDGFPNATIWQTGNFGNGVMPITHAVTDKFSLATLTALDVLGLPSYLLPFMAQYRHDTNLAPLKWFNAMPGTLVKWSTAGDMKVNDGKGGKCVVKGKSGNAPLRRQLGVYCNVRSLEICPGLWVDSVRTMPGLPYSEDKDAFNVGEDGNIHSEMNSPGDRMAYTCRHFLRMVNNLKGDGELGRGAMKPTQAKEDTVMAGLLVYLLGKTKMTVKKAYESNPYDEMKAECDRIIALLPADFFDGMDNWEGDIYLHIADTNYGILLHDLMDKKKFVLLCTDVDGDRITDLLADAPKALMRAMHLGYQLAGGTKKPLEMWRELGFWAADGLSMPSIMHRVEGPPVFEMTLGSADAMVHRILDGHELADNAGAAKLPYNPRIHYLLTAQAMKAANPEHSALHAYLDDAMRKFDEVYGGERPLFFDGYTRLKEAITPWGQAAA